MIKITKCNIADEGILYVLLIHLDDRDLVKIGISSRLKIEERVAEIAISIFKKYRYFPYIYPKRFTKVPTPLDKEADLHRYFREYAYVSKHAFGGYTELFDLPLDVVVDTYDKLIAGELDVKDKVFKLQS
jgi:hypothetical protein